MSPSPTRVPAARAAGRRRRAAALVPAAALLAAGLGVAGAPAFAEDAATPAPRAVEEVYEGLDAPVALDAAATTGTAPAALSANAYTNFVRVAEGEPVSWVHTNPEPVENDPTVFPAGRYWSVLSYDRDGNPATTADSFAGVMQINLTRNEIIDQQFLYLNQPVGTRVTVSLIKVPSWAVFTSVGDRNWRTVMAASKEVDHLVMEVTRADRNRVQFHFHGAGQPASFNAMREYIPEGDIYYGDWDGDGVDTVGYRVGAWYYLADSNAANTTFTEVLFANFGDIVYAGDWDGDGVDTLGARRGNTFYLSNDLRTERFDQITAYGRTTDTVYIGDWDGNGTDTPSVRRGNEFHLKNSFTGGPADRVTAYGRATDEVVVGDWNGDGVTTPGVRRGTTFMLKNDFLGGNADQTFAFGWATDRPLVGDWNGDGVENIGLYRR